MPCQPIPNPYRVIYAMQYELQQPPEAPAVQSSCVIVWLDSKGFGTGKVKPRTPKRRMIDVRVGDEILIGAHWTGIIGAKVYRELGSNEAVSENGYTIKRRG